MATATINMMHRPACSGCSDLYVAQTGMFWYSGLTQAQGDQLARQHVYITPSSGRVCLCGLNNNNIQYFANVLAGLFVM